MNAILSFFRSAKNVNVRGTTITTIQNVYSGQESHANALMLDLILKECCLGALLESKERSDPPRCLPGTRAKAICTIREWLAARVSVLWLYGPAGDGKTAIVQTISEICSEDGRYCAGFFCSRTSFAPGRDDPDRVIPTLLYQILLSIPQLQPYVFKVLQHDPGIFSMSKKAQMKKLIVEPLSHLPEVVHFHIQPFSRQLIVIDGLDECGDVTAQRELLNVIIGAAVELKAVGIGFLVSSRPEFHIRQCFENIAEFYPVHSLLLRLDLSRDASVDTDIRRILKERFSEIRRTHPIARHLSSNWPPPRDVNTLISRSSGHFLYLSTALKYIACDDHRPDVRLQVVLGLQVDPYGDNPFDSLDALYQHLFSCVNSHHLKTVLTLFGLIYIQDKSNPRHKVHGVYSKGFKEAGNSPYAFTQRALYERMLDLLSGDIELMMKPLLSIVEFWPYPLNPQNPYSSATEMRLRVIHSSVFDFLLDASRSTRFHLEISSVHRLIADYFFKHVGFEGYGATGQLQTPTDFYVGGAARRTPSSPSVLVIDSRTISKTSLIQLDFLIYHLALSKTPIDIFRYNRMTMFINTILSTVDFGSQCSYQDRRDVSYAISKCYCYLAGYYEEHCQLSYDFAEQISEPLFYAHPTLRHSLESYVHSVEGNPEREHLETMLYMIKTGVGGPKIDDLPVKYRDSERPQFASQSYWRQGGLTWMTSEDRAEDSLSDSDFPQSSRASV